MGMRYDRDAYRHRKIGQPRDANWALTGLPERCHRALLFSVLRIHGLMVLGIMLVYTHYSHSACIIAFPVLPVARNWSYVSCHSICRRKNKKNTKKTLTNGLWKIYIVRGFSICREHPELHEVLYHLVLVEAHWWYCMVLLRIYTQLAWQLTMDYHSEAVEPQTDYSDSSSGSRLGCYVVFRQQPSSDD